MVAIVPRVPNTTPRIRIHKLKATKRTLLVFFAFTKYRRYIIEGKIIMIVDDPIAPVIPSTVPKFFATIATMVSIEMITMVTIATFQYSTQSVIKATFTVHRVAHQIQNHMTKGMRLGIIASILSYKEGNAEAHRYHYRYSTDQNQNIVDREGIQHIVRLVLIEFADSHNITAERVVTRHSSYHIDNRNR